MAKGFEFYTIPIDILFIFNPIKHVVTHFLGSVRASSRWVGVWSPGDASEFVGSAENAKYPEGQCRV